jgi:hypothetical protein
MPDISGISELALGLAMFYAANMNTPAYKSVREAVQGLKSRGFTANLEMIGNAFRAVDTGKTFVPADLTIVEHHRFEGASDPEELAVVYAIEAHDGTSGVLVDAYGVYANPEISAFLKNVRMKENL